MMYVCLSVSIWHVFVMSCRDVMMSPDTTYKQLPSISQLHPRQCAELGFFCMGGGNNSTIEQMAYQRLAACTTSRGGGGTVLVYGGGLAALGLLGRLERLNVDRARIVWVNPETVMAGGVDNLRVRHKRDSRPTD